MQFYDIDPTMGSKWFWASRVSEIPNTLWYGGMRGFKGSVCLEVTKGTTPGDFLWNDSLLIVVSEKVLSIWGKYKSFVTYDIKVTNKTIPFKYYGVAVTGHGGPLDFKKSKARYHTEKGEPRIIRGLNGLYFYEDKWDGSDIMYIDEYARGCLISERVKDEMKKAKINSCEYTPIEEITFGRPRKR